MPDLSVFARVSGQQEVVREVRARLEGIASGADGGEDAHTFFFYGFPGAGKTYLLSKIMTQRLSSRAAGDVIVVRFLGTTPLSSNVHALLTSVCEQLRRAYGRSSEPVPSDFKALKVYFHTAVTAWPTADRPLTLFIDSVDQVGCRSYECALFMCMGVWYGCVSAWSLGRRCRMS